MALKRRSLDGQSWIRKNKLLERKTFQKFKEYNYVVKTKTVVKCLRRHSCLSNVFYQALLWLRVRFFSRVCNCSAFQTYDVKMDFLGVSKSAKVSIHVASLVIWTSDTPRQKFIYKVRPIRCRSSNKADNGNTLNRRLCIQIFEWFNCGFVALDTANEANFVAFPWFLNLCVPNRILTYRWRFGSKQGLLGWNSRFAMETLLKPSVRPCHSAYKDQPTFRCTPSI